MDKVNREGMMEINVGYIIKEYLRQHNYDGLAGDECGCSIDDLAPCSDGPYKDCQPARLSGCGGCKKVRDEADENIDNPCPYGLLSSPAKECIGPVGRGLMIG